MLEVTYLHLWYFFHFRYFLKVKHNSQLLSIWICRECVNVQLYILSTFFTTTNNMITAFGHCTLLKVHVYNIQLMQQELSIIKSNKHLVTTFYHWHNYSTFIIHMSFFKQLLHICYSDFTFQKVKHWFFPLLDFIAWFPTFQLSGSFTIFILVLCSDWGL